MTAEQSVVEDIQEPTGEAVRSPWLERMSRLGYAAKGIVYALVGILGIQVSVGIRAAAPGTEDALYTIVTRPFGTVLLGLVAAGLFFYTLWRFVQAWRDPEGKGNGPAGLVQRAGYIASGMAYAGLGAAAIEIISRPWGGPQQSNSTEDWTATFLALPFGPWLVGLAGLAMLGYGLEQLYESLSGSFRERLNLFEMPDEVEKTMVYFGRFGYAARAVVYSMVGIFLIRAAYLVNAEEAEGLREVLQNLVARSYGPWLLGAVSFGILSYGLFSLLEARYRTIEIE